MESLFVSTRVTGERPSTVAQVFADNELRLDRLEHEGVELFVDGAALLQFFFERVLANDTVNDFRRSWALNVAGLLSEAEAQARTRQRTAA